RVFHQHFFELTGVHVESAAQDHVLRTIHDVIPAVRVFGGQIAGAEPAVTQGFGGRFGPIVVALHDVVAFDGDLADRLGIIGDLAPIVVNELHLHAGNRFTDRADPGFFSPRL